MNKIILNYDSALSYYALRIIFPEGTGINIPKDMFYIWMHGAFRYKVSIQPFPPYSNNPFSEFSGWDPDPIP
jgi:hypothetical protein